MRADWCVHYNGLGSRIGEDPAERRCDAGVLYDSVRAEVEGQPRISVPCIACWDHGVTTCELRQFPTPEEVKAADDEALARLTLHTRVVSAGRCPHCGNEMTSRKVGHCLYAEPCGHRLNEIPREIKGTEALA